jgi:type I restriction enzyme, S subunit
MNAERLLAHYHEIADAPDAIARLRRFILDLAVRGKLVPQNANDEPASELLKAIVAKRGQLAESGIVRPSKALAERSKSKKLFDLPRGWAWTNANQMWDFENGDRSKNYPSKDQLVAEGIPFINAGHLDGGLVSLKNMNFISQAKFSQLGGGKLRPGDQLYCLRGSLGKHAIFLHEGDAAIASSLVILRPIEPETVPYLSKYLDSDIALMMLNRFDNGTAQPNLSSANLRLYEIPLPPLAEQHRIVAKVDELMGLCDRLERARKSREAVRDRLASASLARLGTPDLNNFQANARFALDALPALTTRPDQIKQLRQAILNLAVRGKLVAQDYSDKPTPDIMEQMRVVRRADWKEAKLREFSRRGKAPPKNWEDAYVFPEHEDGSFEIPNTWAWASTLEACDCVESGSTPPASEMTEGHGEIPYIKVYNLTRNGTLDFSVKPTFISRETHEKKLARSQIIPGDVLMNIVGPPLGKVSLVTDKFPEWNTNQAVVLFRPLQHLLPRYLVICLLSDDVLSWIVDLAQQTVGQVNISVSKSRRLPIPLPPIAEQHRIVAKVDALMTLCDRLEANLTTTAATRRRLLDALLAEALAPVEDRELEAAE